MNDARMQVSKFHRRWFWIGLKFAIAVILFYLLASQGKLDLRAFLQVFQYPFIPVLIIGINFFAATLTAWRWYLLLVCQKVPISFFRAVQITYIGIFFNIFLPGGGLGGDALRMAYVVRASPFCRGAGILSIFTDRVVGLYSLFLFCFVSALFNITWVLNNASLFFLALAAALISLGTPLALMGIYWVLLRYPGLIHGLAKRSSWLGRGIHALLEAIHAYRQSGWRMLLLMLVSMAGQVLGIVGITLVGWSMGVHILSFQEYAFVTPWTWIANILPLTPGGMGVGEAAFDQICQWVTKSESDIAYGTIFFVWRVLYMIGSLPGLVAYLFYRNDIIALPKS
ncbi:MAG: flippase-like domain-containing protein [Magnetococcus sp. DMHC-6]